MVNLKIAQDLDVSRPAVCGAFSEVTPGGHYMRGATKLRAPEPFGRLEQFFSLTVSQRHTMRQRVATSAACAHEWRRMFRLSQGQRGPYPGVRGRKVFSAWPPHSANSHFSKFSFSLFSSSSRISVVPISGPTQRFLSQWHTMRRHAVTVAACAPVAVNSSCCVRSNRGLGPRVRG